MGAACHFTRRAIVIRLPIMLTRLPQIYLYIVLSSYGNLQRRDHEKYDQLDTTISQHNDGIPLANRNDPWDSRPSTESMQHDNERQYSHVRQESAASASDVLSQPYQQSRDGYSDYRYENTYPPQTQPYLEKKGSQGKALSHPSYAYTQEPGPTPQYSDTFYGGPSDHLDRPPQSQTHPGESRF